MWVDDNSFQWPMLVVGLTKIKWLHGVTFVTVIVLQKSGYRFALTGIQLKRGHGSTSRLRRYNLSRLCF